MRNSLQVQRPPDDRIQPPTTRKTVNLAVEKERTLTRVRKGVLRKII